MKQFYLLLLLLFQQLVLSSNIEHLETNFDLIQDLEILHKSKLSDPPLFPVYYSNFLYSGYFTMPSALFSPAGTLSSGVSRTPPYLNYNLGFQLFERLELSGSYRIFQGVTDGNLSQHGFGSYADKGINYKFSLIRPEESDYLLPGVAFGSTDFLGTKKFFSYYFVLTKVFNQLNTECSLGYGWEHIDGFFGAINIIPFRKLNNPLINEIAFTTEYDATNYNNDPSPYGRTRSTHFNWGLKYRLFNTIDFTINKLRGEETSVALNLYSNLGETKGMLPKFKNPLPYYSPINTEPIGIIRPSKIMIQNLAYILKQQGFKLIEGRISKEILSISIQNNKWAQEQTVRDRLTEILSSLIPSNIKVIEVTLNQFGTPIQTYKFTNQYLADYRKEKMGLIELSILSPLSNSKSSFSKKQGTLIYKKDTPWYKILFRPTINSYFGSAAGKYKYSFGLLSGIEGNIANKLFYRILFSLPLQNNLEDLQTVDKINPSQIINVRSDLVDYKREDKINLSQGFIQKNWNLGRGWFASTAGGYFEYAYGGTSGEILYYPINKPWAIGIEGAWLKKREYSGLGFTNQVRQLNNYSPKYVPFHPWQAFVNYYIYSPQLHMEFSTKAGAFLAKDLGVRFSAGKYFSSGLKVSFWTTITNANDTVNATTYYDQGISISFPLDWFLPWNTRRRLSYSMAAWLRDAGASASTGIPLYEMISSERFNY